MKPLLIVLPFHRGDFQIALGLVQWISELGGARDFPLLLLAAKKVLNVEMSRMNSACNATFGQVFSERAPGIENEKWPRGANLMFKRACELIQGRFKLPFLWMEPDVVIMKPGAFDAILTEYQQAKRWYMGNVRTQNTNDRLPRTYLPGCSVYPSHALSLLKSKTGDINIAWDVSTADLTVPHAHNSKLFYEWWGIKGQPPMFKATREPGDPDNVMTPKQIPSEAVFFHRCKDGALIRVLQGRAGTIAQELSAASRLMKSTTPSAPGNTKAGGEAMVHIVERHKPEPDRVLMAIRSWQAIYDRKEMAPLHIWPTLRSSAQMGDSRNLPYLKDLLGRAMDSSAEIVVFTNGDIVLHPETPSAIQSHLKHFGALSSFRINVATPPPARGTLREWANHGKSDLGRDLFAFRKSWLATHWDSIPNFFVGEWEWDLAMAIMIRMSNKVPIREKAELSIWHPSSELPLGYIVHQNHERKWLMKSFFNSPAKRHNLKLANEWYSQHGLADYRIDA